MDKENVISIIKKMDIDFSARNLAIYALRKQIPQSPHPDGDIHILACPNCGSGEYLHNEDGNLQQYCGQCGQAIDWEEEIDHEKNH